MGASIREKNEHVGKDFISRMNVFTGFFSKDFPAKFIIEDVYDFIDKLIISSEYQKIFTALHTLSCEYRDILVDYYIEEQFHSVCTSRQFVLL